jgi:hypothetical protein
MAHLNPKNEAPASALCLWDSQGRLSCSEDPFLQWIRVAPSCQRKNAMVEGFTEVDPFNCDWSKYSYETVVNGNFVRVFDYKCGEISDMCTLYCNKQCEEKKDACKYMYGNNAIREYDKETRQLVVTCKCKQDSSVMGQAPL